MQKSPLTWLLYFSLFAVFAHAQNCDLAILEKEINGKINTGDYKEGQKTLEQWPICAQTPFDIYKGKIYQYQLYRNQRRFKHAFRSAQSADSLQQSFEIPESWPLPDHWLTMAEAAANKREFKLAKKYLKKFSGQNLSQQPSLSNEAYFTFIQATIAQHGDRVYDQAQQLYREALNLFLELSAPPVYHTGQVLRYLGATHRVLGDFEQSLYYYERELATYTASYSADHREIANTHYNVGAVLYELLRYEEALSHFLQTYQNWKEFRKPENEYMRYLNEAIGDMYWELGNRDKALEFYDQSIAGEKPVNNDQAYALLEQGDALLTSGQQSAAMQYFQKALDWRVGMYGKQHAMTGACQNFIGKKLFEAGHFDDAIHAYQQTIRHVGA